ncbi:MAG: hypothetical protein JJV95_06050 [Sulfurospirillum sp.]|nr:hypothetical protein [Sulfurospirillum sp.]MBL0703528.1 hypothetical protein [Sulfurospirillum sp.]
MGTTISKLERESLDELFVDMQKKQNFLIILQNFKKDIMKFYKIVFIKQKILKL